MAGLAEQANMRLHNSLHFKVASGVIATVVLLSALYLVWDNYSQRQQSVSNLQESAADLNNIVLQSLIEVAMLGRHPELLQPAIERLGTSSSIVEVFLLDRSGVVRFSSSRANLGRRLSFEDEGCRDCHADSMVSSDQLPGGIFYDIGEEQVLRNLTPVLNREECHSCHDPSESLNGLLVVDLSTSKIRAQARANTYQRFIMAGLTVFAILAVLGILMNKLVILRLKRLTRVVALLNGKSGEIGLGNLKGNDEISQLAQSFDRMASRVRFSIRELQGQKAYLQELINSLDDALVVVDRNLTVELTNHTVSQTLDGKQLLESFVQSSPLPSVRQAVRESFRTGRPTRNEISLDDQETRTFEVHCSPVRNREGEVVRVIVLFRDIAQRKRFERHIHRTERLASVGQLAAGVAHEINNPMAAITTCAEGLGRYLEGIHCMGTAEKQEIKEYLRTIGQASSRCKEITERLLSASAEHEAQFEDHDLAEVVEQVLTLIEHEAKNRKVEITTSLDFGTAILGNREKLSQLLLNLTLNSLEAAGECGCIHIAVAPRNGFVELQVADDGAGIPKENLERIFDPFFTTKKAGRGTGLGLYICEGIVRQHQGQINVSSEDEKGTHFTIHFPRSGDGTR